MRKNFASGLQMAVEVDDGDGSVGSVHAAEEGKGDGVVTAEGNDTGKRLSLLGWADLVGVCRRLAHEDAVVALFDLLDRILVVVSTLN
jgi:hypothetical protein